MKNTSAFSVAIVGLGRAGRFHLHSVLQLPAFRLSYIVDTQAGVTDELDLPGGVTITDSIDPVLADPAVAVVIIATPTQFHFEQVCRSLQAGKHVFSEKPLGKTADQIRTCYQLAQENKRALWLGFQRRYDRHFIELKTQLPRLGDYRLMRTSSRDNPKPSLDYLKISGNIFHDMLIHDFDMLLFLLGEQIPETVFAMGHAYDPEIAALDDFDTVLVTIQYPGGFICSIDTSRTAPYGYDQRIEIFGEKGMLKAENETEHQVIFFDSEGQQQSRAAHSFPQRYCLAYREELAAFAAGITRGDAFNISPQSCLLAHAMAEAAHLSAVEKRVVDFPAFFKRAIKFE